MAAPKPAAAVALPAGWSDADERHTRPPTLIDFSAAGIALPSLRLGPPESLHVAAPLSSTSTTRNLVGEETGHVRDDAVLWASSAAAWVKVCGRLI